MYFTSRSPGRAGIVVILSACVFALSVRSSALTSQSSVTAEMQRLSSAFAGRWKTTEVFTPNEFYPHGAGRKGVARFTLSTGGTSLLEEVHSDGSAGALNFMVVVWWNEDDSVYDFFTCGNAGTNPCKFRGTAHWDGDSFVNEYESTIRGTKRRGRDVFSHITPNSFTLVAYIESAGAFQPIITTYYRRKPEVRRRSKS